MHALPWCAGLPRPVLAFRGWARVQLRGQLNRPRRAAVPQGAAVLFLALVRSARWGGMSAIPSSAGGDGLAPEVPPDRRRRRRRPLLAVVVLPGAGVAVVLVVTSPFGGGSSGGVRDNASATSLATVRRRSLTSLSEVGGTVGYTGDVAVDLSAGTAPATLTQAQQAVTTDQSTLANARSTLSSDSAGLSQTHATLTTDQQQEGIRSEEHTSALELPC